MAARKHYWWRYLLFVLLGFVLGIGSVAGGIVAAGYIINGEQVEKWTGQDLLTEDYQSKSLIDLITQLAQNKDELDTLGAIAKITPKVDELVDKVNEMFQQNIGYSWPKEEMYQVKFDQLGDWLITNLKEHATIAAMINAGSESSNIMKLFLFPKDDEGNYDFDHPYTLNDFMTSGFFDRIINSLQIQDILDNVDPNNALLNAIKEWTLDDFQNPDKIYDLTIKQLLGTIDENNALLVAIQDWTINDLKDPDKIYDELTIAQIVGEIDPNNKLLNTIKDWTIRQLMNDENINGLTIADIMGEIDESNAILYAIRNLTISDLKDKDKITEVVEGLTIQDVLGTIPEDNAFLNTVKTWKISDFKDQNKVNALTIRQVLGDDGVAGSKILQAIADIQIGNLKTEIENLPIESFIDFDSNNKILKALEGTAIKDLSTAIQNLSLGSVIDPADLAGKEALYTFLSGYTVSTIGSALDNITIGVLMDDSDRTGIFKYLDPDTNISDIADAIKGLKVIEAFEDDIFEKGGHEAKDDWEVKSIWKFMLTPTDRGLTPSGTRFADDPNKDKYSSITVGDGMGTMVENFQYHVENEDLNALSGAGLVTVPDGFLTKAIPPQGILALTMAGIDMTGREYYGQLKVNELTIVLNAI